MTDIRNKAIDRLTEHNIRPSEQRIAVMNYLIEHRTHPSVDRIYEDLHPTMPTLSRTTVYNVLRNLVEKGAALMLTIDDKNTRYDADTTPHAHFRCSICGCLADMPQPQIETHTPTEYLISETHVYYHGICPKCREKQTTDTTDN